MARSSLLLMMMFCCLASQGQNILITFTGTGAATQVDTVRAANLRTSRSVTLPGDKTLVLTVVSGIPSSEGSAFEAHLFPNPFAGKASFSVNSGKLQPASVQVLNLAGQLLVQTDAQIQPGENTFSLSLNSAGIFIIRLVTGQGTISHKMICTQPASTANSILYQGTAPKNPNNPNNPNNHNNHNNHNIYNNPNLLKSSPFTLEYTIGDIILFTCTSGIYTTVLADSPSSSRNCEIGFAACTDAEGKHYAIVNIGTQTWMAENLTFLPSVSPVAAGSDFSPYYYVYDYNGNLATEARASAAFARFGVLYNWLAARTACPAGWHLPDNTEWSTLTDLLEPNPGGKLKATGTAGWVSPNTGATNESGFSALPGGLRSYPGGFSDLGQYAYFWSATEGDATHAWIRILASYDDGVGKYAVSRNRGYSVRCILNEPVEMPVVTTSRISAIERNSASGGGQVTSDGGAAVTARGICWSMNHGPTLADPFTSDGSGTGEFVSSLAGLSGNTDYYVRAYATNSAGTAYGNEVIFKTAAGFTCGSVLTTNHIAGAVAPVTKTVNYGTVSNIPGEPSRCWLTSNLGAENQAILIDDTSPAATGWYWQFNRKQGFSYDGTTRTPNTAWISEISQEAGWEAANDPCVLELGDGWRLPTLTEWMNVDGGSGGVWNNWNHPWYSGLKLHAAGMLKYTDGSPEYRGSHGMYWSSTRNDASGGWVLDFSNDYCGLFSSNKANGYPVRCIR